MLFGHRFGVDKGHDLVVFQKFGNGNFINGDFTENAILVSHWQD
jgi:hypothetical protein